MTTRWLSAAFVFSSLTGYQHRRVRAFLVSLQKDRTTAASPTGEISHFFFDRICSNTGAIVRNVCQRCFTQRMVDSPAKLCIFSFRADLLCVCFFYALQIEFLCQVPEQTLCFVRLRCCREKQKHVCSVSDCHSYAGTAV